MSFQELKPIVNIGSSMLISGIYSIIIYFRYQAGLLDLAPENIFKTWGVIMLIFIGISIGVRIMIYILFYIAYTAATREEPPKFEDERDKLIELKASKLSIAVFWLGFIFAWVGQVTGLAPSWFFITLFLAGLLTEITSESTKLFLYRRGV